MKYIVEVGEPVPSNLDEIASKVAASFNISDAKAMALLRRAPGAMTKAVSEREADVVAGIFERAGLNVVKRPAADGPGTGAPAGAPHPVEGGEDAAHADGLGFGSASGPGGEDAPAPVHPPRHGAEDVWDQPLGATDHEPVDGFSRRDAFEEESPDIGWEGDAWGGSDEGAAAYGAGAGADAGPPTAPREPEVGASGTPAQEDVDEDIGVEIGTPPEEWPVAEQGAPDAGQDAERAEGEEAAAGVPGPRAEEPGAGQDRRQGGRRRADRRARQRREKAESAPRRREATGRSAERGPDEARAGNRGVSGGIAWVGVLPPLLSLLAMGVAMLVTLVPVARDQQAAQAADAAAAQAAALEALTGGLPLTAQTLSGALADLSNNAQALLRPNDVSLMVVTDANGAPLAGWYGPAKTPAAMPPATRQAVSSSALMAVTGQPQAPTRTFTQSLRETWRSVEAMAGGATRATVLRAAPVVSAGQPIGSVVVGVPPVSSHSALVTAFESVLLVGLIPLLIGILMAMGVTGGMRRKVRYLLQAADRISRGELDEPVTLRGRDAFGQLARAIERMRVSLSTLLEHRRRHR